MFLCGYLGTDAGSNTWCAAVRQHAGWLGFTPDIVSRSLPDGRILAFARLAADPPGSTAYVEETDSQIFAPTPAGLRTSNAATVAVSLSSGELSITIPPSSPQQFYYVQTAEGYLFGDDLRLFPRLVEVQLDEAGIYALFHYGAVPAPLTIWRGVRRARNGHRLRLSPPSSGKVASSLPVSFRGETGDTRAAAPDGRVSEALDALLARVPSGAVLYFSGGVDSSLLAARLVRAGRRDIRLINYGFGPHDQQSLLARQIATHLGLECEEISHDATGVARVLERLGRDYSFPFVDLSTIPMNALVHASVGSVRDAGVVVEGTGADGAFGLGDKYPRWRRAYAIPEFVRRRAGGAYGALRLWERRTQVERLARFLRNSAHMPLGHAVVAQNALDGIAYGVPSGAPSAVAQAVREGIETLSGGAHSLDEVSMVDVTWACAGRMAPKSFDPLRMIGVQPIYPFLEPAMVRVSTSLSADQRCPGGEAKAILKRLLAADIPRDWVYRPKKGFTPPFREIFAGRPMQAYMHDVALAPQNPLLSFCRVDMVKSLVDQTRVHGRLPAGAYEFLWALTFTSGWLQQQPAGNSA